MISARPLMLFTAILLAAVSRLLPHPPNVTPVAAMALFAGAQFSHLAAACAVPLAAMVLSDMLLGFHSTMPFVYGSFLLIVLVGTQVRRRKTLLPVVMATLASSVLFFVVLNFGVWVVGRLYPMSWAGVTTADAVVWPTVRNRV